MFGNGDPAKVRGASTRGVNAQSTNPQRFAGPGQMLQLTVLGGLSLISTDARADLAQRGWQRAAVLALLAGAGPRGLVREQLIGWLWPDAADERGRHSLNEVLSRLRRDTGSPDIFVGTTRLTLNPTLVSVDGWQFAEAVSNRHVERAVQLYRGSFAEGVRTTGLVELEQHLEGLRAEYQRAFAELLEYAAQRAADRHDHAAAARWWQRIAELDPCSERIACELVSAYAAIPDMASALRALRVHEALVEQELGVPPGQRLREWRARLTQHSATVADSAAGRPAELMLPRLPDAGAPSPQELVDHIRGRLAGRYGVTQLLEAGSIFLRLRGYVPSDGARPIDVNAMQPRAAAFVDEHAFVRAMEHVVRLSARHILPTLEVGSRSGVVYVVTSPMPELTLRALLRREGALAIETVLRLVRGLASALASAHESGVHHGDLRPRHVGVLSNGEAIVGGFGVVPALVGDGAHSDDTAVLSYGSPRYLSPEQRYGRSVPDARSDIYAFGCTVHHMLTGEPPIITAPEDPASVVRELARRRPNVPRGLLDLLTRCICLHPADRFANGRTLVHALDDAGR